MISHIIITLESDIEKYLYGCLDSLLLDREISRIAGQELIAVIKPEKTGEKKIRSRIEERYDNDVRCLFSPANRSGARNIGFKAASNDIINFLDSDTRAPLGFTSKTVEALTKEHAFRKNRAYVTYSTKPLYEEIADKRRLYYFSKFMNLNQWWLTSVGMCRPYGFCMTVRKGVCEQLSEGDEIFLERLAGCGEDAEFGSRYGAYCRENGLWGIYLGDVKVETSFREWHEWGFWRGGARMIINTFYVPVVKRPVVGTWR